MAVDYTRRATYKDTTNAYKDSLKDAREEDYNSSVDKITKYASYGASFGTAIGSLVGFGGLGGLAGAGTGALVGVFANLIDPITSAQDKLYAQVRNLNVGYYNSALKTQTERNDVITQAKYYVNKAKGNFETTYGKESFSMLESTISTLLGMSNTEDGNIRMSEILGGLKQDTIVGDIVTRLYKTDLNDVNYNDKGEVISSTNLGGIMDESKLEELSSQYLNLETLGQYYISSLYESIVSSDTTFADSADDISRAERLAADQVNLDLESTMLNNATKFSELFLNMRSQNISDAQNMGETEAQSGASGIKASKSSRTANQVMKLNQDIASASYAILYTQYKKQLDLDIKNNKVTQEQVGFQYASQRRQLKKQTMSAYQSSLDSWWESTTAYAKSIGDSEVKTDDYMAAAKAGESLLKENKQDYDDSKRYIYSTGTATA